MLGQAEGRSARTHRHQMSSGGPRERAPCERALRHDRSVGRWLDEDPHWPNPRLVGGHNQRGSSGGGSGGADKPDILPPEGVYRGV